MRSWPWAAPPWEPRCWRRWTFFTELERRLSGRPVALFGSYGWGDGQWMRDWVQRTQDANANLYQDQGLMINETPDEDGLEQCREFGRGFAKY